MPVTSETVGRIFVRQRVSLAAYVWAIVHDDDLVEDVLQDVFAIALRKGESINDESHLHDWLRKAARLESLKALRERTKDPLFFGQETLDLIDSDWKESDKTQEASMKLKALHGCVERLTPRARKIITLRYVHGLKPGDIAEKLGQKAESLYVTMSRILSRLGECVRTTIASKEAGQ